jgi:hypothetical protein
MGGASPQCVTQPIDMSSEQALPLALLLSNNYSDALGASKYSLKLPESSNTTDYDRGWQIESNISRMSLSSFNECVWL